MPMSKTDQCTVLMCSPAYPKSMLPMITKINGRMRLSKFPSGSFWPPLRLATALVTLSATYPPSKATKGVAMTIGMTASPRVLNFQLWRELLDKERQCINEDLPRSNEHRRSSLTRCTLDCDEHTIDCDHPKDVWEYHGTKSVDKRLSGGLMLKAVLKETQICPRSSRSVGCGIQTRTILAREKIVHVLAACNMVRFMYRNELRDNKFT